MEKADLKKNGEIIKQGGTVELDENAIKKMAVKIGEQKKNSSSLRMGCLVMQWIMIGTVITLGLTVAYLMWKTRHPS